MKDAIPLNTDGGDYFKPRLLPQGTRFVFPEGSALCCDIKTTVASIIAIHKLDAENYYALMSSPPAPKTALSFFQKPEGIIVAAVLGFVVGGVATGLIVHYVPK